MFITLYSFNKRNNSTKQPTDGTQLDVLLKGNTSIFTPSFEVNKNVKQYNYLKFNNWYYYITDTIFIRTNLYQINCELDVLATFKSDILNTTCYVNYSASNYDDRIIDNRFSTVADATTKTNSSLLITDGDEAGTGGSPTYLLNYATDLATVGATGFSWCTGATALSIASKLNSTGFNDFLKTNEKQLQGAYDSILSCKKIPMAWHSKGVPGAKIHLGGYDTGVGSITPVPINYETTVTIPWQFNDFRNLEPYTSLFIFLPNYGFVNLTANDFIGKNSINVKLVCDPLTGDGTYIVGNVFRAICNFATDFQIGTSKNNVMGINNGLMNAIGGAMVGNVMGTVGGIVDAVVSANQRNFGVVGGISSSSCCKVSIGDWRNVYCITICHDINQPPTSVVNTRGLPTKKVLPLSSLTGYVETVNASVKSYNNNVNETINQLLDGGVYIE